MTGPGVGRVTRRLALASLAASVLGGCGFELRHAPELRFRTIALVGFRPRSPLAEELRLNLNASLTTLVVDEPTRAQVVLESITDARDRSVVASTAAGQVRELQLRTRFGFRLRAANGRELIPATELLLSRDMSYSESIALAKEQEEALLFRTMQSDIVAQVMRRLAAVQAP
ncbi:MAG TPA: LPS assembly lipoprotein LptE [Albitalea sp.]|nr:LPS assembly lipoprotein LptE [Albitalea sp.]